MKSKNLIIGIVVIIIIAIIIATVKLNEQRLIEINKNMTTNELVGKWNAISEETIDGVNDNLKDIGEYSITFKNDGSYSEIIGNSGKKGLYKLEEENVTLYNSPDDLKYPGSLNKGWFLVENNQLTLTLPKYPKTVVYRRA